LLERGALSAPELLRRLAEEEDGEDVGLLERRGGAEGERRLVGRAGDPHLDRVLAGAMHGGDVEGRVWWRGARERDRPLLEREAAALEHVPAAHEPDLPVDPDRLP